MDLSTMTWSSVRYSAKDIARHSLPVIVRQRSVSSSQRQVTHCLTTCTFTGQQNDTHVRVAAKTMTIDNTSGYATWFTAGGAICIAVRQLSQTWKLHHYDVIDDVITRKL